MKTRWLILLLFLGFMCSHQAKAQVTFGLRGGMNFSTFYDTPSNFNYGTRTGFLIGGYLNVSVPGTPFSVQPEILYSQKGYGQNGAKTKLDHLEIPVLLKVDLLKNGAFIPYLYAGPSVWVKVNAAREGYHISKDTSVDAPIGGFNENAEPFGFGVVAGAGIDVNRFNAGIRYNAGITRVFKMEQVKAKTRVISVVAGFEF